MPAPCKPPPGFSQPMAGALPSRPRRHHVRLRGLGEGRFADGGAGDYYQDGSLEEGGPGHGVGSLRRRIQGRPGRRFGPSLRLHLCLTARMPPARRWRRFESFFVSGGDAGASVSFTSGVPGQRRFGPSSSSRASSLPLPFGRILPLEGTLPGDDDLQGVSVRAVIPLQAGHSRAAAKTASLKTSSASRLGRRPRSQRLTAWSSPPLALWRPSRPGSRRRRRRCRRRRRARGQPAAGGYAGRGGADGGAGWGHWSRGMASSWTGDDGIGRPSRRQAGSREKGRSDASCPCPPAPGQAAGSGALMPLRRME